MTVDKKQIITDLIAAHHNALVQAETDLNRFNSQPVRGQEANFYRAQRAAREMARRLRTIVTSYESLLQDLPGKSLTPQVGSLVVVRMGINNEIRNYFIHNGFLVDPHQWSLHHAAASSVHMGDLKTFHSLKVGDTYTSDEGRSGDDFTSVNHVIDIL